MDTNGTLNFIPRSLLVRIRVEKYQETNRLTQSPKRYVSCWYGLICIEGQERKQIKFFFKSVHDELVIFQFLFGLSSKIFFRNMGRTFYSQQWICSFWPWKWKEFNMMRPIHSPQRLLNRTSYQFMSIILNGLLYAKNEKLVRSNEAWEVLLANNCWLLFRYANPDLS